MTREKLIAIIESWLEGDCPREAMLDALLDYGIDVDEPYSNGFPLSLRAHLIGCNSYRRGCDEMSRIRLALLRGEM